MKPAHGTSLALAFFAFWCAARLLLRMKEYTAVPIHSLGSLSCCSLECYLSLLLVRQVERLVEELARGNAQHAIFWGDIFLDQAVDGIHRDLG